jgi:hypothetical protein
MLKSTVRVYLVASAVAGAAVPALAQGTQGSAAPGMGGTPPPFIRIYREEVRPGKGAAHSANEAAWAAAFNKNQTPERWLALTTIAGPSEAWFVSPQQSWEAMQREDDAMEANPAIMADADKYSALDGELLSRTSTMIAAYRPNISFQSGVMLPQMRYMAVDMVRVKPGRVREFVESWREVVAAHEKAKMNEHWAVFQVVAGYPDGTFLFMYPMKSLAEIDQSGPMHTGEAYRDAVGESGRIRMNEVTMNAVEMSQRLIFSMNPKMSLLPKEWTDADPYWAPKPAPAPALAAKTAPTKKP